MTPLTNCPLCHRPHRSTEACRRTATDNPESTPSIPSGMDDYTGAGAFTTSPDCRLGSDSSSTDCIPY